MNNNKKLLKVTSIILVALALTSCNGDNKIKKEVVIEKKQEKIAPQTIKMPLLDKTEMVIGDSRVIEVIFKGKTNLSDENFKNVTERGVKWNLEPKGIITIDKYGRVEALKEGIVSIEIQSLANPTAIDKKIIKVVATPTTVNIKKNIVNYQGEKVEQDLGFQKFIDIYSVEDLKDNEKIPEYVKKAINNKSDLRKLKTDNIIWEIVNFSDGSDNQYILRTNKKLKTSNGDKLQYFMGKRYLPGNGKAPQKIISDKNNGIWVIGDRTQTPFISHIRMEKINWSEKAEILNKQTDKYVVRMGFVSNSKFSDGVWKPEIADNDGLWTSMYGAGELMHYATIKNDETISQEKLEITKNRALRSLKSVLLLSNIAGRENTVDAKLRFLTSSRTGAGNKLSKEYLKKGAIYGIDNFSGSPVEKQTYTGTDANTIQEGGNYIGGIYKYSLEGINKEDWIAKGEGATSKRNLSGFIARTVSIPEIENTPYDSGIFLQRNKVEEGKQQVLSQANRLYDFEREEKPLLSIGNREFPKELLDVLKIDGKQYKVKDLVYKADTSSDEVIGHLFLYKIAFDILDEKNKEERELKKIIADTVRRFAQHMIDNQYTLVDATGQGTTWGKTTRDYFNNDYTFEDSTLNSLVLLATFKTAYYITGEIKFQEEYKLLIENSAFRYLDLANNYFDRWLYVGNNENYERGDYIFHQFNKDLKISKLERERHAVYIVNKSDEEMAMLAYYLIFQLETDDVILDKYKVGLNGWWHSVGITKNPLWYYIYQLAHPSTPQKDLYGNNLIETAAWELKRFPMDLKNTNAFFYGSRPDVAKDSNYSVDIDTVLGKRINQQDIKFASDEVNFKISKSYDPKNIYEIKVLPQDERNMYKFNETTFYNVTGGSSITREGSTTFSLPYWFGRYHGMLKK